MISGLNPVTAQFVTYFVAQGLIVARSIFFYTTDS
jgi:hypothetical protein